MAGRPLAKKTLAELERRGGPEYLEEWLLEGKSLRKLAAELELSEGYFRKLILRTDELAKAVDNARRAAADAHFDAAFEAIQDLSDRRQREIMEALNGENSRDISEANVSPIDLGITKQKVGQHNLAAQSWNQERYGNKSQQSVTINIGDLHLDALRKMKIIDHE
jgi:hypothetical protein